MTKPQRLFSWPLRSPLKVIHPQMMKRSAKGTSLPVGCIRICGQKKAGATWAPAIVDSASLGLLRQQHVARVLDRARDGPLVLRAQARVLAGQDLARVRDETHPGRGIRERNLGGCGCLYLGLVGAHGVLGREIVDFAGGLSTRQFLATGPAYRPSWD